MTVLGVVANPASGKDVRRLVARASVFDNQEKQAIVRRALVGAAQVGVNQIAYMADTHGITANALEELELPVAATAAEGTQTGTVLDTISCARAMADLGCSVVVTLGGDGTNRAFTLGWRDATLLPLSTGTNNVFPVLSEATVAGAAAGLIATGQVDPDAVCSRAKVIEVQIDGELDDLALIDAVLTRERFVGARALLDTASLSVALLTRADPAAVGMTSIGGLLAPLGEEDEFGMLITIGEGELISAPIAPGYYRDVPVRSHRLVNFKEEIVVSGPGVLALDGERERVLKPGQTASMRVGRSGPKVVDIRKTMVLAARQGVFRR